MSWKNEQKCPILRGEGVHLNQSAYAPKGNGCPLPVERRNAIKDLCLRCPYDGGCLYDRMDLITTNSKLILTGGKWNNGNDTNT